MRTAGPGTANLSSLVAASLTLLQPLGSFFQVLKHAKLFFCPGPLPLCTLCLGPSVPGSFSMKPLKCHLPRETAPSKLGTLPAICPLWEPCQFPS